MQCFHPPNPAPPTIPLPQLICSIKYAKTGAAIRVSRLMRGSPNNTFGVLRRKFIKRSGGYFSIGSPSNKKI